MAGASRRRPSHNRWGDAFRVNIAASQALVLLIAVATAVLAAVTLPALRVPRAAAFLGAPRSRPQLRSRITAAAAAGGSVGPLLLDELISLAASGGNEETVAARVDSDFARLKPEELASLQTRLAASEEAERPALQIVATSVQAAMERRMDLAKSSLDELLMSSGDIDANIRECLERQDSPLPMMAVLQMNIGAAQRNGAKQQEQALTYIFKAMNAELERKVPEETRVLSRLLTAADADARRTLLRDYIATGLEERPNKLCAAINDLVADVEKQYAVAGDDVGASEKRLQTLELIRSTAIDGGIVIGEVFGDDAQGKFTEDLTPLFEALSKA